MVPAMGNSILYIVKVDTSAESLTKLKTTLYYASIRVCLLHAFFCMAVANRRWRSLALHWKATSQEQPGLLQDRSGPSSKGCQDSAKCYKAIIYRHSSLKCPILFNPQPGGEQQGALLAFWIQVLKVSGKTSHGHRCKADALTLCRLGVTKITNQ